MTNEDLTEFTQYWSDIKEIYGKQTTKNEPLIVFNALRGFGLEDIKNALTIVMQTSKFAPTVADVIEAIKELKGEDPVTLEARANKFYNELNKEFSIAHDIVTTDKRGVIAFYQCFNSIQDFGSHPLSADPFDKKAFVKAYVSVKPYWLERAVSPQLNVIKGIYHNSAKPKVKFIGNKDCCFEICKVIYKDKIPDFIELTRIAPKCSQIDLKQSSGTQVLQEKKNVSETNYVTKEEFQKFFEEFEKALKGNKNA